MLVKYCYKVKGMEIILNMKKRVILLITWIAPVAYLAFIWYLSSQSSNAVVNTGLRYDNQLKELLHFVEFAGLYVLIAAALFFSGKLNKTTSLLAMAIAIFCGFLDEAHQYFVPARSATVNDFLKDAIGVIIAWYLCNRIVIDKDETTKKI